MPYYPELKVVGWTSGYKSIQRLLKYLKKKRFDENGAQTVLDSVAFLCRLSCKNAYEVMAAMKECDLTIGSTFSDELRRCGADAPEIDVRNAHFLAFAFENKAI